MKEGMTKMKKVTTKLLAIACALAMMLGCTSTVFATEQTQTRPTIDNDAKGSITLTKYDSSQGGKGGGDKALIAGAEFSAYKVIGYNNGKYTVVDEYERLNDVLKKVVGATDNTSYGSVEDLESVIAELQAVINAENSGITADASGKTGADGTVVLGKDTTTNENTLDLGVYLVQETVVPRVPEDTSEPAESGYTISSQAFLVTIPQWNQEEDENGEKGWIYDVKAYPKDEAITADKKIVTTDENGKVTGETTSDSYSIGDTIEYRVTATIPNYGFTLADSTKSVTTELLERGEYDKYNDLQVVFTDTLSQGLTLNVNESKLVEIKVLDTVLDENGNTKQLAEITNGAIEAEELELKEVTGYDKDSKTPTYNNNAEGATIKDFFVTVDTAAKDKNDKPATKMTVTISWSALDAYQGKKIELRYSARLNENAAIKDPNTNDVKYSFTNDPQKTTGDGRTEIEPPDTETYTYQLDLTKLLNGKNPEDVGEKGTDASGVTFRLYEGNSTEALYVKGKAGSYTICTDAEAEDEKTGITLDIHPDTNGALTIKGFEGGTDEEPATYRLEETSSIKDYTLLTAPIMIKVEEVTGDDGKVTGTVKAYIPGEKEGEEEWLTDEKGNDTGIFKLTVNNVSKQFNLPQTGGMGLWMFTIAGGILMAAAIIFFHKLRMRKGKNA